MLFWRMPVTATDCLAEYFKLLYGETTMIILISGTTHTGKTNLAQRLLVKYQYPYLSMDHLKMGLIRSGQTELTPSDDRLLVPYLWSITKEMIKTAIENKQNLIVEGCYIPFDWQKDFTREYLADIRYICLIMSESYIRNHFDDICNFANIIEQRLADTDLNAEALIQDNCYYLEMCEQYQLPYFLIEEDYHIDVLESIFS